jgi:Caspase domain
MLLNRYSSLLMSLFIIVLMCISSQVNAQIANRVALIMTNSAYDTKLGALINPHRDAELMQSTLTQLGFKVTALRDGTQQQMKYAVADFTTAAAGADLAFIYYSGHGAQADGASYLIPIGAKLNSPMHYELETLPLENLLKSLSRARPKNAVVVLDACRDNPLAFTKSTGDKGLGRLPEFDRILIAQAAPQGRTTPDNGLYAKVLSQTLLKPNLTLVNAFLETNASIRKQTSEAQVPRISEVTIDHEIVLSVVAVKPIVRQVLVTPETKRLEVIPATYKTVTTQIQITPEYVRFNVIPATFKTVTEQFIEIPAHRRTEVQPTVFEEVEERVMVRGEEEKLEVIPATEKSSSTTRKIRMPAEYITVKRKVVKKEAVPLSVEVAPAIYKTLTRKVVDIEEKIEKFTIPAVYKTTAMQVIDVPAYTREVIIPAVYKSVILDN